MLQRRNFAVENKKIAYWSLAVCFTPSSLIFSLSEHHFFNTVSFKKQRSAVWLENETVRHTQVLLVLSLNYVCRESEKYLHTARPALTFLPTTTRGLPLIVKIFFQITKPGMAPSCTFTCDTEQNMDVRSLLLLSLALLLWAQSSPSQQARKLLLKDYKAFKGTTILDQNRVELTSFW